MNCSSCQTILDEDDFEHRFEKINLCNFCYKQFLDEFKKSGGKWYPVNSWDREGKKIRRNAFVDYIFKKLRDNKINEILEIN